MPPVREASTKPSAATVLPAPVACSNQKRRAAPGSSGCSGSCSSSSSVARRRRADLVPRPRPRPRPLPRPPPSSSSSTSTAASTSSSISSTTSELVLEVGQLLVRSPRCGGAPPLLALDLGDQRGQRARQRIDLVSGQHGAVDEVRLVLREQPLEAEHQRVLLAPLDEGSSTPASISASAASTARRRAVPGRRASGSSAIGSRDHSETRSRSSREGTDAAFAATAVVLAISRLPGWLDTVASPRRLTTLVPVHRLARYCRRRLRGPSLSRRARCTLY